MFRFASASTPGSKRLAPARSAASMSMVPTTRSSEEDRKSTRLNSSHRTISYAVFCLKKEKSASGRVRLTRPWVEYLDPPRSSVVLRALVAAAYKARSQQKEQSMDGYLGVDWGTYSSK